MYLLRVAMLLSVLQQRLSLSVFNLISDATVTIPILQRRTPRMRRETNATYLEVESRGL